MNVLAGSYPAPCSIIWTFVILPSDTIVFNLAIDPSPVPSPTTSKVGGDVYYVPALEITTLTTFPLVIMGFNEASLPVKNDTFGCRE